MAKKRVVYVQYFHLSNMVALYNLAKLNSATEQTPYWNYFEIRCSL